MKKTLIILTAISCLHTITVAQTATETLPKPNFFERLFGKKQPVAKPTPPPAKPATGKPIGQALGEPIGQAPAAGQVVAQSQKKPTIFERLFGKQKTAAQPQTIDQVINNNTTPTANRQPIGQTTPTQTATKPPAKKPSFFDKLFSKKKTPAKKPESKKLPFRQIPVTVAEPAPAPKPAQLAVVTGKISCKGKIVTITPQNDTYTLTVPVGKRTRTYVMRRVHSDIGAVRLENNKGNAYWLQLANKSMLLDTASGGRLADNCRDAQQQRVQEELNNQPSKLF